MDENKELYLTKYKWNMWYHEINDNNWSINSYKKICTINSLESFKYYYNNIDTFIYGMFFMMKEDIIPLWEDEKNINGGIITYKITKKKVDLLWNDLSMYLIGNKLCSDKNYEYINGISISPKINNCIIKIWISDSRYLQKIDLNKNIKLLENNSPIYKTFNNTSY